MEKIIPWKFKQFVFSIQVEKMAWGDVFLVKDKNWRGRSAFIMLRLWSISRLEFKWYQRLHLILVRILAKLHHELIGVSLTDRILVFHLSLCLLLTDYLLYEWCILVGLIRHKKLLFIKYVYGQEILMHKSQISIILSLKAGTHCWEADVNTQNWEIFSWFLRPPN